MSVEVASVPSDIEMDTLDSESSDEDSMSSEAATLVKLFRKTDSDMEEITMRFEHSTYDGVAVALVLFCDKHYRMRQGSCGCLTQLVYIVVLHFCTIFAQFFLVHWTFVSGLLYEIDPYSQAGNWADMLVDVVSHDPPVPLDKIHPEGAALEKHCKADTTHSASHMVVLAIWGTRMVMELADASWRCYRVWVLPEPERHGALVDWQHEPAHVRRLTLPIRILLTVLNTVPQFTIAICLAWMGAKLLAAAISMSGLVLKALTLQYIIGLDSMVFNAFSSVRFRSLADHMAIKIVVPQPSSAWKMWGSNSIKLCLLGLYLALVWVEFSDLRRLRHMCHMYLKAVPGEGIAHEPHWLFGEFPKWLVPQG